MPTDPTTMPRRVRELPRDHRGFPIPWFTHRNPDGTPDFRVAAEGSVGTALRGHRCWVCGHTLGRHSVLVTGPTALISGFTPEPPGHIDCMRYAVRTCPFLVQPKMRRNENNLPGGAELPHGTISGHPFSRLTVLWWPSTVNLRPAGVISLGPPRSLEFWLHGERAARDQTIEMVEQARLHAIRLSVDAEKKLADPLGIVCEGTFLALTRRGLI